MSSTSSFSSSTKNTYERKSDEALNALVNQVQQVYPAFMKDEGKTLDGKSLNAATTYWALEVTLAEKGIQRKSGTMSMMTVYFDDGESMVVLLPEKAFNRFYSLLQSQKGKKVAILSFSYNPADHTIMFRDVGTMVLIQDGLLGEMVIPECNYGPHSQYTEPATAVSIFTGSKRLFSEVADVAPAPSHAAPSVVPSSVPSPAAALSPVTSAAAPLEYLNLDRAALLELIAKILAPKPVV